MTIDLSKIKNYLQISVTTHDVVLTSFMTAVCAFAESYCNRVFVKSNFEEIYSGNGQFIFLKNYPVVELSKVEYKNGPNSNPNWTEYVEDDFDLVDNRKLYKAGFWFGGVNNIRVTYSAGYENNPADLEQALIELIAKKLNQRKSDGISGEGVDGANVNWVRELSEEQKIIVKRYKKVIV